MSGVHELMSMIVVFMRMVSGVHELMSMMSGVDEYDEWC